MSGRPLLHRRRLGTRGLEVSSLGLGCVGMSELYGPREPEESRATLLRALELGITLFDTSDLYGDGHNESLLSEMLSAHRDEVAIATKFGAIRNPDGLSYRVDGSPEWAEAACEASLRRLGTEVIDLYYVHRIDPETPIEDTVGAMAGLVKAGKVRFLGLCECSAATLRRAHAVHPISAVQTEYSLFARGPEAELMPTCRELGVGFVPYSPLGRGALTGRIQTTEDLEPLDYRRFDPRFREGNWSRNLDLVRVLDEMARDKGCSPGQLALAWLLERGDDVVPIPGTRRRTHLEENVAAAEVALSAEERERIGAAFAPERIAGRRYPASELARVDL